jgi:hypothetical protein
LHVFADPQKAQEFVVQEGKLISKGNVKGCKDMPEGAEIPLGAIEVHAVSSFYGIGWLDQWCKIQRLINCRELGSGS